MPIPTLSPGELADARAKAIETRRVRAALKNAVRSGAMSPSKALAEAVADPKLKVIKVLDFLKAVPRVGEKRAIAIMEKYSIAANRRLGGLGSHQFESLKKELG